MAEKQSYEELVQRVKELEKKVSEAELKEELIVIQRDLSLALNSIRDLNEGLKLCLKAALHVSAMDCGGIYLVDENSGALDLISHEGLPPDIIRACSHYESNSENVDLVLIGAPIYAQHHKLKISLDKTSKQENSRAFAALPISHYSKIIGCLNVASHVFEEVPVASRNALETIASMIGGAIHRLRTEEYLRESEYYLREVQTIADIGSWRWEIITDEIHFSNVIYRLFGWRSNEVVDRERFINAIYPDESGFSARVLDGELDGELDGISVYQNEYKLVCDGELRIHHAKGSLIRDKHGKPIRMIGFVHDITKRKTMEGLLKEEKDRAQNYLNMAGTMIVSLDETGKVNLVNKKGCEILETEEKEIIGKDWFDNFIPEVQRNEVKEVFSQLMKGEVEDLEHIEGHVILTSHNTKRVMSWDNTLIKNSKGRITGTLSWGEDITERKRIETDLAESEKRFRLLLENMLIGVAIIRDGRILYSNTEYKRLCGSDSDAMGNAILYNIHPDDAKKTYDLYEKLVLEEIDTLSIDFRYFRKGKENTSREIKWVQCRASLVEYRDEKAILFNMMDVTKIKELEQALRIADKMSSLGRVAAGIAHEIRNPLTGINSFLYNLQEIIDSDILEANNKQLVTQIIRQLKGASQRIESVIKRVMDFSKPTIPKMILSDINIPVHEAAELSSALLRKNGIELEKNLSQDLPHCYVDSQLISQVVLNLISNAVDALKNSRGAKYIEICTADNEGYVYIEVSDSGPGVSEEIRYKMFDPFFTTRNDGSGIGLSIVQRVAADHGGSIRVATSIYGGAKFVFRLPIEKRMMRLKA